jgi:hypothetical protein
MVMSSARRHTPLDGFGPCVVEILRSLSPHLKGMTYQAFSAS